MRRMWPRCLLVLFTATTGLLATPSFARDGEAAIAIGTVTSEESCQTYVLNYGREAAAGSSSATGYSDRAAGAFAGKDGIGIAGRSRSAYSSRNSFAWMREWGQELVTDCQSNFADFRQSLRSALTASGKVTVAAGRGGAGAMVLDARISEIGFVDSAVASASSGSLSLDAVVSVEYTLEDQAGNSIFGNMVTKTMRLSSGMATGAMISTSSQSGRTIYTQMQREAAMAIARDVVFKLYPPRVTAVTPRRIELDYASSFLPAGSTVFVQDGKTLTPVKCIIAPSGGHYATAIPDGGGSLAEVQIGSQVRIVEKEDPAAAGRRYERVDLPN